MKTDTSEKGLEDLIVAGLTNSSAGTTEGGVIHDGTAGYGTGGWILGSPGDYNRDYAVDLVQAIRRIHWGSRRTTSGKRF